MPYKRKNSPCWWVSYTDPSGQRVRRSTGTTDRKEAAALEAKWKLETFRVQQWEAQPTRSFEELMVGYLKATANEKRSANKDRERTRHLRAHFAGRILGDLSAKDVRAYIAFRKQAGISSSTINRELALFSAAINYAVREWDWEIPNVVRGRKLKEPEGRVRWLNEAEVEQLLDAAGRERNSSHLPDFIRLALHTGCRRDELLRLEWERVDFSNGLILLDGRHTKSGKRRSVPINATARQALLNRKDFREMHCPQSPWVFCNRRGCRIASVRRSFMTACARAGIKDFRIHDLRHTCAAWLVTRGVPLTEVRELLGHSTVRMTERYAHLAPENVRVAVARLDVRSHSGHIVELDAEREKRKEAVGG